ncbi:type VI secretion system tip protein VgrG [Vibrio sp. JC009]|uniref:type VI secretion system Vgr family protein n=1 Tax=Vibrio sp. JC009 TaxID=2912314 RepID=UPI0023B1252F|nr:type VI secretion system tip protein TssI/VgrG [Vibrio sp. JC009]WED20734.1 type VI secretion system tip protein VgrG [Vibrio sp. JC009]
MAKLHFKLLVNGLDPDCFLVRSYEGHESLSDSNNWNTPCYGFSYKIELASRHPKIDIASVVDQSAELVMLSDGQTTKTINGIVRSFRARDTGHHHTFYSLTLVPALERLSLRHNSRIFQLKTVPEILSILLREMNITDYRFDLRREYSSREYCVQYRETDLEFLHRIAAEEGLIYRFTFQKGKHSLLFSDDKSALPKLDFPVLYNPISGGTADSPYIFSLSERTQSQPSHTRLNDHSFKKPRYNFSHSAIADNLKYQRSDYEYFDFPGRYKDDHNGKVFSRIRLEYLRREARTAAGTSNHPALRAGVRFELHNELDSKKRRTWTVVSVTHRGTQPQALEEEGGSESTTYHNELLLIPAQNQWRATPKPKPLVDGPMIATVVGPEGEEIYCDKYGRVKIHFPWDRYSEHNDHSTCWVRVSQSWAGSQYGEMVLPRVGHEVIVSFLNGDPDQPIITGRTFHATNPPPYKLPDHKTKTVLRSKTHQGEGFNELSFEDQSDQEQIYLRAQRDYQAEIKNDLICHIGQNSHKVIKNDSFILTKNNQHTTVQGESRYKVNKDQTLIVGGNLEQKTTSLCALEAGTEVHLKSGTKIVLESGSELTLKVGSCFVKVDPAGIHISGPAINLNSGGCAGSGAGFSEKIASLPFGLIQTEPPAEIENFSASPQLVCAEGLVRLSAIDAAIAKMCQKQADGSCPRSDCPCQKEGSHAGR